MDPNFTWTTRAEKLRVIAYWWEKQDKKCCICGQMMQPYGEMGYYRPNAATVEHLIPRRENGPNTAGNVRLAHAKCNHEAGAAWEQKRQAARRSP